MNNLFENCISEINTFYNQKGYQLGWRFLTCSKKNLEINPAIALITLNPGGNEIPPDHPWESCENGNAYLFEQWGNSIPGKSSLQIQVQLMFEKIAQISQIPRSGNELLEDSFSAHFVPFRSPRLDDLKYKSEAFAFAKFLWTKVLQAIKPKLFICIDRETYKQLLELIPKTYNLSHVESRRMPTGWGNYNADIDTFIGNSKIKLLRLPHLSTFKLFTSKKCVDCVNDIFEYVL